MLYRIFDNFGMWTRVCLRRPALLNQAFKDSWQTSHKCWEQSLAVLYLTSHDEGHRVGFCIAALNTCEIVPQRGLPMFFPMSPVPFFGGMIRTSTNHDFLVLKNEMLGTYKVFSVRQGGRGAWHRSAKKRDSFRMCWEYKCWTKGRALKAMLACECMTCVHDATWRVRHSSPLRQALQHGVSIGVQDGSDLWPWKRWRSHFTKTKVMLFL